MANCHALIINSLTLARDQWRRKSANGFLPAYSLPSPGVVPSVDGKMTAILCLAGNVDCSIPHPSHFIAIHSNPTTEHTDVPDSARWMYNLPVNASAAFGGDLEYALYYFAFLNTSDGQIHPITGKIIDYHPYNMCHKYTKVSRRTTIAIIVIHQLPTLSMDSFMHESMYGMMCLTSNPCPASEQKIPGSDVLA